MTDTDGSLDERLAPMEARTRPANPFAVALAIVGALAWMMAFGLGVALAEVTDYETYDLGSASTLTVWVELLILGGFVAFVGVVVIAGVRHEHRTG